MRSLASLLLVGLAMSACDGATGPDGSPDRTDPPAGNGNFQEGAYVTLNVNPAESCGSPVHRRAQVVAVSRHAIILADSANPSGGLTTADYRELGEVFDQLTWQVATRYVGEPADIDSNGKVLILFTRAVNEMTPRGVTYVVSGFFHSRDLFPKRGNARLAACGASNEAEMFYMLAADPEGTINGNVRKLDYVRKQALTTLGHELEHLINASRRLHVNDARALEESWLDEGLAHAVEELIFYEASGLGARQNLDLARLRSTDAIRGAVNTYQINNLHRYSRFLQKPQGNSPFAADDSIATRGAAWAFLRYAADRKGGDEAALWRQLVNSTSTGMENLAAALGGDPLPWFQGWATSVYTDDVVTGDPIHSGPSWNFRSVLPVINGNRFPLQALLLEDGVSTPVEVKAGSAAYLRFAVAADAQAELRLEWGGQTAAESCRQTGVVRSLALGEALSVSAADARSLCFAGGGSGAEFVYIPFHASTTAGATASLKVSGDGLDAVDQTASANRIPSGGSGPSPFAHAGEVADDGGWEQRLREQERRDLNGRILGGAASPRLNVSPSGAEVLVTVVRTR